MGRREQKAAKEADGAEEKKVELPPAKSIFKVCVPTSKSETGSATERGSGHYARVGELLGGLETPCFTVFTSRGFPFYLRPEVMSEVMGTGKQLWQVPMGDAFLRTESVKQSPNASKGCRAFWPHLENHMAYCSFRNIRMNPSIFGGDAVCSVETRGGRRKVGPKEWLDVQRAMKMDVIAAPAEEVTLDAGSHRRVHRSVDRAGAWLKEILEAKATDEALNFDWHVLATIQGCGDVKVRQKACAAAAAMPVAGFVVGGLGYEETLAQRAAVLDVVAAALPPALPRFLPLNQGTPIEILQGVLLGIDVFEITYPIELAFRGVALTCAVDMPADAADVDEDALAMLLPEPKKAAAESAGAASESSAVASAPAAGSAATAEFAPASPAAAAAVAPAAAEPAAATASAAPESAPAAPAASAAAAPAAIEPATATAAAAPAAAVPKVVRQEFLHRPECREDFGPITQDSPVKQYSRAYFCHLIEVRELLGTMLLAHHNLDVYVRFFAAIRQHAAKGTFRRYVAWFMKTQTGEPPAEPESDALQHRGGPAAKKRKT